MGRAISSCFGIWSVSEAIKPYLRVNLYFTAFAAMLGVIYLLSRVGLPDAWDPTLAVIEAVGLTAIVILGPCWMPGLSAVPDGRTGAIMNLFSWLVLGGLVALSYLGVPLGPAVILVGVAVVVFGLHQIKPGWRIGHAIAFVILAALFAVVVMNRPSPPFSFEQALAGTLFPDTYFHFSITQMLRWQGSPSIGVDGVPWYFYHHGSNFLIARLSALMDIEVPIAYPALLHLLFLPLFLRSLALIVVDEVGASKRAHPWLIALPLIAVIAYVSMTNDIIFISPSYLLSLSAMLALLPMGLWIALGTQGDGAMVASPAAWIALVLMLAVVTALKTSSGLMVALALLYLLMRGFSEGKHKLLWAGILVAVFAAVFPQFAPRGDFGAGLSIEPFRYYFEDEIKVRHQPFFFAIYGIFSVAYLIARLIDEKVNSWSALGDAIKERRIIDVEMISLITFAGLGPGVIFYASGHLVWIYFYDFSTWLALPLLCGWVLRRQRNGALFPTLSQFPIAAITIVLLMAPLLYALGPYLVKRTGKHLADIIEINRALQGEAPAKRHELSKRIQNALSYVRQPTRLAELLTAEKNLPTAKLAAIEAVIALRNKHGEKLAAYVPPTNAEYWTGGCRTDAMALPALTGVPLIAGMPLLPCRKKSVYGYAPFAPRESNDVLGEAVVCERAQAMGFSLVYRVNSFSALTQNSLYQCSGK